VVDHEKRADPVRGIDSYRQLAIIQVHPKVQPEARRTADHVCVSARGRPFLAADKQGLGIQRDGILEVEVVGVRAVVGAHHEPITLCFVLLDRLNECFSPIGAYRVQVHVARIPACVGLDDSLISPWLGEFIRWAMCQVPA